MLVATVALGAVGLAALTGCEPALFPERTPRTQYDWYDQRTGDYRPAEQPGQRGETKPALRERLAPNG